MECLYSYLPRDLINIVDDYYTTFRPIDNVPEVRWRSLLDCIGSTMSLLGVRESYACILYKFYDYHMRAWALVRKKISPRLYQLFGLLLLYRVAPAIFDGEDVTAFFQSKGFTLNDLISLDQLIDLPVENYYHLYSKITSVLNSACLDSAVSISILKAILLSAPRYNYCDAEILLLWVFTVATRLHIKIRIPDNWSGFGVNLRPRFNYTPLDLFYGIGHTTMARLHATKLGDLILACDRPALVSKKVWSDLCRLLG